MNKLVVALLLACALAAGVAAQKKMKPWTEWSEKEAQKVLDDSPWGQTQVETNIAEMFYSPSSPNSASGRPLDDVGGNDRNNRSAQGALNQATPANYRIRFLSAKPIRQAFARLLELKNPQMSEQLRAFAEQKSAEWIVIAVTYDSRDQRFSGRALQAFNSANTGLLKNNTYLEDLASGKRLFLQEYIAPINDGLGAKFVFPRSMEGQPFISPTVKEVRFYSEVSKEIKLNMRFKVANMVYNGQLEF